MKNEVRNKALELGFQEIGFAKYEPLGKEITLYKQWLDKSNNANMKWMENNLEKRADPSNILPDIQSVIVLSFNYYSGHNYNDYQDGKNGKIARYAWNYDYHEIVKPKLLQLAEFMSSNYENHNYRVYVDTGPVMEKIWAEKAGIGWQGKNSLILSKNFGSYFFIGVILSNISFESDSPVKDYCMSCTKCLDACPTQAITEPKVVDSEKCISYRTIESKPEEKFPDEIKNNLSGWIFGCDICQEVCPWNKHKPQITDDIRFHPRNNESVINFDTVLEMKQQDFSERFRKSPIKRAKFNGLKRNIQYLKMQ